MISYQVMSEIDAVSPEDRRILVGVFVVALLIGGAGIFFEMGNRSGTICKKTLPLAIATAIESAVNNFYTEYGKLPDVGNRVTTNTAEGLKLLNILLGLDAKSDNALNSRAIKFLSVKEGKNKKNGLIYAANEKSVEGLYDPWGNPYTVVLDVDFDEHLQFNYGAKSVELQGRRVAVYSPGLDKKVGTSDDIKTW